MSRIGKNPIVIPSDVQINYSNTSMEVSGPKGKLKLNLIPEVILEKKEGSLIVKRNDSIDPKRGNSMQGLFRMLINNMIVGVTKGYSKQLEIVGTGYKAIVEGKRVVLNLGYSYPYIYNIPDGLKVVVEENTNITIEGIDKQLVGQAASEIRKMRPPEPYKGKGIKYKNEFIRKKAGKAT